MVFIRIAICDDDKQERQSILEALHNWDPTRVAELFVDGKSLLKAANEHPSFSIVFLDIYMPEENGIEVARELKKISPQTGIVFITTSPDFAVEAFAVQALHYLVKPVTTEGIREAFARIQKMQFEHRKFVSVKINRYRQQLYLDEIAMLNSSNHEVVITLMNNKTLRTYSSLNEFSKLLDQTFLQLQRGLIVNMAYIKSMRSDRCTLQNGQTVLLSRKERAQINQTYNNYVFDRLLGRSNEDMEERI